ncbi:hypothetical protein BH23THE1_BH23THE1_27120 [soil metagenome]
MATSLGLTPISNGEIPDPGDKRPTERTVANSQYPRSCQPFSGYIDWDCYCGWGTTCTDYNGTPTDKIDLACMAHDLNYGNCTFERGFNPLDSCYPKMKWADSILCEDVKKLLSNARG